jgi:CubicO group peptidase (beta-lactamase class C family)
MSRPIILRLALVCALFAAGPPARPMCSPAARPARTQTGSATQAPPARAARPGVVADATFDVSRLGEIDTLVEEAIKARQLPGAVVLVGHDDVVVYRKAFGNRSLEPSVEPMTLDTIFDMASLT